MSYNSRIFSFCNCDLNVHNWGVCISPIELLNSQSFFMKLIRTNKQTYDHVIECDLSLKSSKIWAFKLNVWIISFATLQTLSKWVLEIKETVSVACGRENVLERIRGQWTHVSAERCNAISKLKYLYWKFLFGYHKVKVSISGSTATSRKTAPLF